ncbi:MAG: hypothetical protein ACM3KJ_13620, partial [Bacillota bacterium]
VFAAALVLLRFGDSLLAGFAVLAAMLLAAALALPLMLELVLGIIALHQDASWYQHIKVA